MTKKRTLQILRGTTAQNDAYTGSAGELTMDTTTNELRLHDGSTLGGHIIGNGGGNSGFHPELLSFLWSDHEISDVQWLRADTFSWQDGTVYDEAYDHLADDISGQSLTSETIAGTTVQFYLATDGHKICPATEESNVASIYTATGVAWYYILDTVNQRFKLPRTQFGVTGFRDTVGNYVAPGAPNITGKMKAASAYYSGVTILGTGTGALYLDSHTSSTNKLSSGTATVQDTFGFDASLSNSIYGNSTTVQPAATQMYLYFYVGNFTQTALENTAGLNAELFNDKVDLISSWGAPTSTHDVLTLAASGTDYTAPADGYVVLVKRSTAAGQQIILVNETAGINVCNIAHASGYGLGAFLPCKKGDTFNVQYNTGGTTSKFWFIYTQKSN